MVFCCENCYDLLLKKKCYSEREKHLQLPGGKLRNYNIFEITRTIFETEYISDLFRSNTLVHTIKMPIVTYN